MEGLIKDALHPKVTHLGQHPAAIVINRKRGVMRYARRDSGTLTSACEMSAIGERLLPLFRGRWKPKAR